MKQARCRKMQQMQEEVARLEVTGGVRRWAGKVTINGAHNYRRVETRLGACWKTTGNMLEDLVAAAFNDAPPHRGNAEKKKASVSAGMQLPPGFKDHRSMQTSPLTAA